MTEASPQLDKMLHAARKELNEVLMDLSDELEENGKYYQFTYHFLMKQYTKLNEISVKIQVFITHTTRMFRNCRRM